MRENITAESMTIDSHVKDCKLFLQDMDTATKVGKKWLQEIEDFLAKIQSCSNNIALEAAVISGKYQETKIVAAEADRQLEACLGSISNTNSYNRKQPKRLYASAVKGNGQTPEYEEDDFMTVKIPPLAQKCPGNERLGNFPPLEGQSTKKSKRRRVRVKKKTRPSSRQQRKNQLSLRLQSTGMIKA